MEVERAQAHTRNTRNGGFPEPVAGEPVRLVRCRHEACGTATRVRVPQTLPARAVRRVVCEGCSQTFDCGGADDDGVVTNASQDGGRGQGRVWKYLSLPLAAAAVILVLILVQSGGSEPDSQTQSTASPTPAAPPTESGNGQQAKAPATGQGGELVQGSSYSLALPDGWARTDPPSGATFAAEAQGGDAQATLWVDRDPSLSLPDFESRSLAQLREATGVDARVTDTTAAPTAEGTIVTLAADSPPGGPEYEVTLRVGGPYRYYLATTVEPDASKTAADGAELIRSSFVPVATGKSG